MEKALVIGGCGYIGTRLVQYLSLQGIETASIDLEWFGKYAGFPNTVEDFSNLDSNYLAQFNTIILLAGHSSVKMCENNLQSSFKNNVLNFVTLLPKLKKEQKFIYASSSSIYGGLSNEVMQESTNLYRALNYYDLSKYEIDSYAKLFPNIEYYGLRFGTVNGFSLNFRDEIMLNSMYKASVTEGVVKLSNLKINRPILGLTDLCRAVLTIAKTGDFSKRGIYNLASFNSNVGTLGKTAADILGARVITTEDRPNAYDFTISTKLFEEAFGFAFQDTIESVLTEISRGQAQITFTNRNIQQKYG
jgi:nucleoside-diphosphate-sugar epimerase